MIELTLTFLPTGDEFMVNRVDGKLTGIYTYNDNNCEFAKGWKPNKNPLFVHCPAEQLQTTIEVLEANGFYNNENN